MDGSTIKNRSWPSYIRQTFKAEEEKNVCERVQVHFIQFGFQQEQNKS